MENDGVKLILVPSLLKYDIQTPLRKTFPNEPYYICQIPVRTSMCYGSKDDIDELKKVIKESIDSMRRTLGVSDIYLIASGGVLHSCYLVELLKDYGLKFKYLIYNKVEDMYYIDDGYQGICDECQSDDTSRKESNVKDGYGKKIKDGYVKFVK